VVLRGLVVEGLRASCRVLVTGVGRWSQVGAGVLGLREGDRVRVVGRPRPKLVSLCGRSIEVRRLVHTGRTTMALCTALAFVTALAVNFSLNRRAWVGAETENLLRHARRYGVLVVANLVFTVLLVSGGAQLGIPYLLAKIVALALSTAWTFALYRAWVFV